MYKHYKLSTVAAFAAMSLFIVTTAQNNVKSHIPSYQLPSSAKDGEDYLSKTVILKVKPEHRSICSVNDVNNSRLKAVMGQLGVKSFGKIYPNEQVPLRPYNANGQKMVDITLIYEYVYTANIALQTALDKITNLGLFEYVEPHIVPKLCYTVNDPSVGSQYHIAKIMCPQAWDISKGDTNVVIGIVDTGTEPTHPDLIKNIKHNYADKVDGIDNDGDGYTDNFSGWDVGMLDNDPTWQGSNHGVHCSGDADASTDNSTGVAGPGFKCKFLPVKIADATGKLVASYTGMQYAAAHGCKVISNSWGSIYWSQYGQDIVNNATVNYDALVVAAAGNNGDGTKASGDETLNYPGSYQNVLGVAATTSADKKAGFSNYNYLVKISAPGNSIYSTVSGGAYGSMSGTSMATPVTAGCAAIVRSYFPNYSALQTSARLCVTADNINSLNATIAGKLGSGRVNLYRALNDPAAPSVLMTTRNITDKNDDAFVANDTLRISGIFTNFLAPTTNLTATLTTIAPTPANTVSILNGTASLGVISTMGTKNNNTGPFTVRILPTAPANADVTFKITYTDGTYTSSEVFNVSVNVDYLNVTVNAIATSVTSKGLTGWNNSPPTQGLGFKYNSVNLMYDGSFIIGVPDSAVSDMARTGGTNDADFVSTVAIKKVTVGAISDFDTEGYMNDAGAKQPLPVLIHHKSYAWTAAPDNKYIMYRYIVRNSGTKTLSNMYAGLIADFDIQGTGGDSNICSYDAGTRMIYTYYNKTNGLYGGLQLLSHTAGANAYAFDNVDPTSGINPNGAAGFTNLMKYTALSTMRTDAGAVKPPGNDVMSLVSTGPITLAVGDSIEVAFAILGGDNLSDIKTSATKAQIKYDLTTGSAPVKYGEAFALRSYPNPASGSTIVDINLPQSGRMELKLYNMIGQEVATIASGEYVSGKHQFVMDVSKLNNGVYYYRLISGDNKLVHKMAVSK